MSKLSSEDTTDMPFMVGQGFDGFGINLFVPILILKRPKSYANNPDRQYIQLLKNIDKEMPDR